MSLTRQIIAHVASVYVGSGMILVGLGYVSNGVEGVVDRLSNWLGGSLIFLLIGILSVPVGLILRRFAERLFENALLAALTIGVLISCSLVPVLHPSMQPSISLESHLLELILLHSFAGLVGGVIWYIIERPVAETAVG